MIKLPLQIDTISVSRAANAAMQHVQRASHQFEVTKQP